jgi:hypothetical protein
MILHVRCPLRLVAFATLLLSFFVGGCQEEPAAAPATMEQEIQQLNEHRQRESTNQ